VLQCRISGRAFIMSTDNFHNLATGNSAVPKSSRQRSHEPPPAFSRGGDENWSLGVHACMWRVLQSLRSARVPTPQCCFVASSCDRGEEGRGLQRERCRRDERRSGALSARQLCRHRIPSQDLIAASGVWFCLLCRQSEPAPQPLYARPSHSPLQSPCRPPARFR
jgi:hypothetical protein